MLKIAITGAHGQLGRDLAETLAPRKPAALSRAELDVTDADAVSRTVRDLRPDVVFNTAAYNHVDRAEDEPAAAFAVNALAPRSLARACAETGALLVHFSTDYVFGTCARTPRLEHDIPVPRGVYATSKLAGEHLAAGATPLHMIVRTSGLYGLHGSGGKGGNFVDTMLRLGAGRKKVRVVNDQVLTPTYSADLARKVAELLDRWEETRSDNLLGLYHVTNAGSCSWLEFAAEIFRRRGMAVDLEAISTAEYGAKAPRPVYSVLAHGHLQRLGMQEPRDWREALADYLDNRP